MLKLSHIWAIAGDGTRVLVPVQPSRDETRLSDEELDSNDPDIPQFLLERRRTEKNHERETAAAVQKREQELQVREGRDREEEDERSWRAWLASDSYRQAIQNLSNDLQDAQRATAWAQERAEEERQVAEKALEQACSHALMVGSDRRVYFTRDGQHLYGEDDREITDAATLGEAHRQQQPRPDATAYEDYSSAKMTYRQKLQNTESLRETAERLDALNQRLQQGGLGPDELAAITQEERAAVAAMPADARAEYDRLRAVRREQNALSYAAADSTFKSAPDLNTEFKRAGAAAAISVAANPEKTDRPAFAYRAAPDFQ